MSSKTFIYPQKTLTQSRSKFKMPHRLTTSFFHGDFNVFKCYEVLPDDTFSLDVASLIRMSTPIAPIMSDITMHLAAYFIPARLVYDNWEQLMGTNKDGAWTADDNTYVVPHAECTGAQFVSRKLGGQLGLFGHYQKYNALPGRCYYLVWNEFYRSQVVSAPYAIDHSSADKILVDDGLTSAYDMDLLKLGKYADQYTKCLPEPQKHDPISIIPEDLKLDQY